MFSGGSEPTLPQSDSIATGTTGFSVTNLNPGDLLRFDITSAGAGGGLEFTLRGRFVPS